MESQVMGVMDIFAQRILGAEAFNLLMFHHRGCESGRALCEMHAIFHLVCLTCLHVFARP